MLGVRLMLRCMNLLTSLECHRVCSDLRLLLIVLRTVGDDARELSPGAVTSINLALILILVVIIVLIVFIITRFEELLLLHGVTLRDSTPASSLALLLVDTTLGCLSLCLEVRDVLELVILAPVLKKSLSGRPYRNVQTLEHIVVSGDYYLSCDDQILKLVVMSRYVEHLDLVIGLIGLRREYLVVMALHGHDLDGGSDLDPVIVPVDLHIFEVVPDVLVAIVEIDDVGVLV